MNSDDVRALIESEDYGDRIIGIERLGNIDPAAAFELLKPVITDEHPRVRYTAASKMATMGTVDRASALELLRDRVRTDSELDVRAAAADALGALGLKEAFDDLQQLYNSTTDWIVRMSVVAALGEMKHDRAFPVLEDALETGEDLVKIIAIGALGELGDDRAIDLILPFVDSNDAQMRFRVAKALGNLNGDAARSALEKLAADPAEQVAREAGSYL